MIRGLQRLIRAGLCLLMLAFLPGVANAGWAVNGDAVVIGNQVLLTPEANDQAGSAWIETRIDLSQDFDISFEMSLGDRDPDGADGISFALHDDPAGTAAFGNTGSGGEWIGMNGICPAVTVEVDTYQNTGRGDPAADHVGVNVYTPNGGGCNGVPNHNGAGPVQASPSTTNIEDGTEYNLRVTWVASTDTMTVYFDGQQRLVYVDDMVNNTFGGNDQVYFGFTASTGGAFNEQYIIPNSAAMDAVKYAVPSMFLSTDTGRTTTYTIDITNSGIVTAFGTQITDSLPTGFTYIPGTTTGATTSEPTIDNSDPLHQVLSWNLTATPIPPSGGTTSISFDVTIDDAVGPGTHRNDFIVSGDNFTTIDRSQTAAILIGPADLSIDKSHSGTFTVGQNETFDIDVANAGPDVATDIVVSDTLPAGMTYVSTAGAGWVVDASGDPTITWTHAGPVASGASAPTLQVTVAVSAAAAPSMSNTASVTAIAPDLDLANNSDTDVIVVYTSDVAIDKSHLGDFDAGTNDTFDLDVSNLGPDDTSAIVVTDTLPAGLSYVSSTGVGWVVDASGDPTITWTHPGPLVATGSLPTITVTVAVDASGAPSVSNTASVTHAVFDPVAGNDSDTDVINVITPGADVAISKTHVGSFVVGMNGSFSIDVSNAGPLSTSNIVVTDTLPAGLTYVTSSGTGWTVDASGAPTITWSHTGPLAPASALPTISLTVTAGVAAMPLAINTASVSHAVSDPDATNDSVADSVVVVPDAADLTIQKNHTGAFTEGAPGSYDLVVSNAGPASASAIIVTDVLDPGFTYTSSSGTGWTVDVSALPTVTWTHPGPLAAGASLPTITLTVTPAFGSGPSITNSASVTSVTVDPDPTDDADSDPTTVIGAGTGNKPLYVRGATSRLLSRDPTAGTGSTTTIDGAGGNSAFEWSIDTVFAQGVTLASGDIPVTLYIRRNTPGGSRTVEIELEHQPPAGARQSLGTDTQSFTIPSGFGGLTAIPFTITLAGNVPIAAGSDFFLTVRNQTGVTNQRIVVDPETGGSFSTIGLTTLNVITVDDVQFYDDAYPLGNPTATFAPGGSVWVRAEVSDPFGVDDISGAEFDIIDANSLTVIASAAPTNSVDLTASTRIYEYEYTPIPATPPGTWTARARAFEGTEGWVTDVGSDTFDVQGPVFSVAKVSSVVWDPFNVAPNYKRIPGAVVQYSIGITNNGLGPADADSFELTDSIPANARMFVGDIGAPGSGPVSMTPGAVPCGMTYQFLGLGSGADDVDFSNNNGFTYNYTPNPDADGYDAGVTDVVVNPKGVFVGGSGTPPSCTIHFRIRID